MELTEILSPGDTIYYFATHVSRSGISRDIEFFTIKDNRPFMLSYHIHRLMGYKQGKKGLRLSGVGMDMGFFVIYELGKKLYDNGYAFKHSWL